MWPSRPSGTRSTTIRSPRPKCDSSLHAVASRPAKAGETLVTTSFCGTSTRGFAARRTSRVLRYVFYRGSNWPSTMRSGTAEDGYTPPRPVRVPPVEVGSRPPR
jgi:hypothetical protein